MCEECGCQIPETTQPVTVEINKRVSAANDAVAEQNHRLLIEKEIFCVNIMGAPGSGKTSVIEGMARFLPPKEIAVIQGDLESDIDVRRMKSLSIEAFQINTHSGCHLNAAMVNRALVELNLSEKQYLLIENVGNLVCPAEIRLGQLLNMVISSTTEGADKPQKYPVIFLNSGLVVISKADLAEAVGFDEAAYRSDIQRINPKAPLFKTSARNPESFGPLAEYIRHCRDHFFSLDHRH